MNALETLSPSPLKCTSVQRMIEASLNQTGQKSGYSAESSRPTVVSGAANGRRSNTNRVAPPQCVQDGGVSQCATVSHLFLWLLYIRSQPFLNV